MQPSALRIWARRSHAVVSTSARTWELIPNPGALSFRQATYGMPTKDAAMDDISESLSQKIDELIEQTTQKVVLPPQVVTKLEDAAVAVAAAVNATERTYGKDITAAVMKKATARHRAKKLLASGGAFDDNTLSQLVGMAIESNISDDGDNVHVFSKLVHGDLDVPAKVTAAARDYETAAEKLLEGNFEIARAEDAMDANAPYLMWMTQEGHGVGVNDGDLDAILDVDVLRKLLDTDSTIKSAHEKLADAITESSFELLSEAYEEIIGNANDVYDEAHEGAVDNEKEREPSDYFPDGPGDSFAYQWNDVERFVEKNIGDTYLGDIAEVAGKAMADGISGEEVEKTMFDLCEYKFIPGFRAMRNCVVSSGQLGDVDVSIQTDDLSVDNPFGKDLTLKDIGEMVKTRLGSEVNVKLNFDADEASQGNISSTANIDGYVGVFVDPKKLAAKLGV